MAPIEDPPAPEPFFIRHRTGQRMLAVRDSKYWALVRAGKITVVGKGRTSRATWASIKAYAAEVLAEAQAGKAA
jgi:hypothetical protein